MVSYSLPPASCSSIWLKVNNERIQLYLGKQGWCCGDCTHLSSMWPIVDPGPDAISGLSLCWFSSLLQGFFSGFPGFPLLAKTSMHLIPSAVSCAPRSHMDRVAATRGAFVCFRFDLVELFRCCTMRRRLAVTVYSLQFYQIYKAFFFAYIVTSQHTRACISSTFNHTLKD